MRVYLFMILLWQYAGKLLRIQHT